MPKVGERDCTDLTKGKIDKMELSNKRQDAARELLPSDEELVKIVPWMMVSVGVLEHVIGDRRVRLQPVCDGSLGTHSRNFVNVGTARIEPELVESSQTSARVERG